MTAPETTADELALLDALFANAPFGLAVWDRDLRYRRINEALARTNGVSVEDHLGRTTEEVLGEGWTDHTEALRRVLETGQPVTGVQIAGETAAEPGLERHWLVSYYPVATRGVAAVVLEVTGEREAAARARRALRSEQAASALVDAVFAAAPVGLAAYDDQGVLRRANPALEALDRLPAAEMIGRLRGEVLGEIGAQIDATVAEVLRTGEPAIDRELAGRMPGEDEIRYRSGSWFPVLAPDGSVLGVGSVVRDAGPDHEAEEERQRLLREALTTRAQAEAQELRAQVARVDAEAALHRVEFLARATERLSRTLDYDETLDELARIAVPELADGCAITMLEPGGQIRAVAVAHRDPEREVLARDLLRRHPPQLTAPRGVGHVIRTGRSEVQSEIDAEQVAAAAVDAEHLRMLRALDVRTALSVPLRAGQRVTGALSLAGSDPERRFGAEDARLAEALAARAALAVENARLYTERSRIAHTLQRALLPVALPPVPGAELAVRYRAAGDQNEVGGDFYDVFPSGDGSWTAIVGDVAGKGAEAAALTSLSRHTLRAAALRGDDPIEHLALLNEALLVHQGAAGGFCTVVVARLCPDEDGVAVTLATGGHLPPFIVRADGSVESVELRGTLVGALSAPHFDARAVRLAHGDRLVLYTDGVVELRGEDPAEGERALLALLRAHPGATADELAAAVEEQAVSRQQGEPRDDIAVLTLRAGGAGAERS